MGHLFHDIAFIAGCSAVLAWLAAQLKQPIIVAYVACGILLGPMGLKGVTDTQLVQSIGQIGVTLLLFIAGLVLHPARLLQLFRKTALLTIVGGLAATLISFGFLLPWGFGIWEALIASLALMFSSTILITKLLPTTTLHQRHMGALAIAILIAQDLIAVFLIVILAAPAGFSPVKFLPILLLKTVLLGAVAILAEQFVIRKMMRMADRYNEVLILLCLGWCLCTAVAAETIGLTHEVGAFMAGISMARSKISLVLSEALKPVRDFFLVLFFFALGAQLDFELAKTVWLPALLLAGLIQVSRPYIYRFLLLKSGENESFSRETGARMGQASEFALLISASAFANGKITPEMWQLIQLTTIATMIMSAYWVVSRYPTPIGAKPGLQRD